MSNKKIKNATKVDKFKSKLEQMVYDILIKEGFNPKYEEKTYTLLEGFKPSVPFWSRDRKRNLFLDLRKIRPITYTPDFTFNYRDKIIIVEVKGFTNDVFPIKFKLFRKYIESLPDSNRYIITEIFTKTQLLEFINKLKQL